MELITLDSSLLKMATKILCTSNVFSAFGESDSDSDGENITSVSSSAAAPFRGCPKNINTHIQRIYHVFDIVNDIYPCSACSPAMSMEDDRWDCPHVSRPYSDFFSSWEEAVAYYHAHHSGDECGGQCSEHPLMDDFLYSWQNSHFFDTTWGDLLLDMEADYWNSLSAKERTRILAEREAEDRAKAEKAARDYQTYLRIIKEREDAIAAYNSPEAVAARAAEKARRNAEREARESRNISSSNFSRWDTTTTTTSSSSAVETRRSSVSSTSSLHHDETPAGGWGGCETTISSASTTASATPAPRKITRCTPTERHRGDGGLMPCKFHCWDNVWGKLCTRPGKDGKVFAPGCSHSDCPYVHPDQPEWNDNLKALFEKRIAAAASRPPRHPGPNNNSRGFNNRR